MTGRPEIPRILRWAEPPSPSQPRACRPAGSKWDAVAETLRDESPAWAVVFEGARNTGHGIRSMIQGGTVACFSPPGSFEATCRVIPGAGCVEVYARHNPTPAKG